jgi:hypothetical protein
MMICESFAMRGFNIDIAAAHLVVRDVPHVNDKAGGTSRDIG